MSPESMHISDCRFHRITDRNYDIYGLRKHTSFEAAFAICDDGGLCLRGKVLDADNREIFCSNDIRDIALEKYQSWDPADSLANFIEAIEAENTSVEPAYFQTPCLELSLEVKGPIASPQVLATTMTMSLNFSILGMYQWKDSGHIHIAMLCHKDNLLTFAKGLQSDLLDLQKRMTSSHET